MKSRKTKEDKKRREENIRTMTRQKGRNRLKLTAGETESNLNPYTDDLSGYKMEKL